MKVLIASTTHIILASPAKNREKYSFWRHAFHIFLMVFKQVERKKSTISVKVSTNLANVFCEYKIQVKQKYFLYSEQEKGVFSCKQQI